MQIKNKNRLAFSGLSVETVQLLCLLFLGVVDFLWITIGKTRPEASEFFIEHYLIVPGLLFVGASLTARQSRAAVVDLALGAAAVIWMALCQCIQAQNWEMMNNLTLVWPIYLMAFPFAAVARDGKKQKGLALIALIAVAVSLVMVLFSAMLSVYILPPFLRESVEWDNEGRLAVLTHPNIAGWMFMIGIAFTLGFFFEVKNKWLKLLLLAALGSQLLMQALTNSRTSILLTCALVGGAAFFSIARGGWKRFFAGLLAALVLAGGLFLGADAMYDWNHNRLSEAIATWQTAEESSPEAETEPIQAAEAPSGEISKHGRLLDHLGTLNGRTSIWKGAFNSLRNHPEYLVRGTAQVGYTAAEGGCHFGVMHLHNSWMEMLVGYGIPGLLIALYLTFLALRGAFWMLFIKGSSMWQKCVALLMLCMLAAGVLEPYLFAGYSYFHFITVVSMMCIGYLNHWYRLRKDPEMDD